MAKQKIIYRIAAAYDTETTTIGDDKNSTAYPMLYIWNDLTGIDDMSTYVVDDTRENISYYRTIEDFIPCIEKTILPYKSSLVVPVVCVYNAMFDITPLLKYIGEKYRVHVSAQNSSTIYTMDLYNPVDIPGDTVNISDLELEMARIENRYLKPVLRFWDMWHLENRGLAAMGVTAGVPKLKGDWDYELTRHANTLITDTEYGYAKRDVQVLPAYLRYLRSAYAWLKDEDFGNKILTKTSLTRQDAQHTIGKEIIVGTKTKIFNGFSLLCKQEMAQNYESYALRKACFRGGLTFTSMTRALQDWPRVVSLDVTSMHHTFITGRMIPTYFCDERPAMLKRYIEKDIAVTMEEALSHYEKPLPYAFHAQIKLTNVRLRRNTVFEANGIGVLPMAKFAKTETREWDDPSGEEATNAIRANGYVDAQKKGVFAGSKLISAEEIIIHVCELEMWNIAQAYEWDELTVLKGEAATKWQPAPAYVVMQSMNYFNKKNDTKHVLAAYTAAKEANKPFEYDMPDTIPQGVKKALKEGTMTVNELTAYYNNSVKGMFNGVYGTQAQDVFKPGFFVGDDCGISIDKSTIVTPENYYKSYAKKQAPRHAEKVLYTYGMRIVGGSRMHLCMALILLWREFNGRVIPTGGDTDSIKCSIPEDVTPQQVETALDPLLDASTKAINTICNPYREAYPQYSATMAHVGGFEVENEPYAHHMEYWPKARASVDTQGRVHITMAGLSQNEKLFCIADAMEALIRAGNDPKEVLTQALGYNVEIDQSIAHSLQHSRPKPGEYTDMEVTDYVGETARVQQPRAIALYPAGRVLGDTATAANAANILFARNNNLPYNDTYRTIETYVEAGYRIIEIYAGATTIMRAKEQINA